MNETTAVSSPAGDLILRPERDDDEAFRLELFCASRQPEFARLLAPDMLATIMRQQFHAQAVSYRGRFPRARGDIVELAGKPIGRIMVDRGDKVLHIVDQAITPALRNRGIGTAIMRALMAEAQQTRRAVRLGVAAANEQALRLYRRLGFGPIETTEHYLWLEWRPDAAADAC
ncbi:MAG TPA: GNAT family N-acetyltransferase [Xanthobacteraceae bacterium]|nr:GNAT family N-acetyltransferase [Xanthobacteraceae bacterium]